MVELRDEIQALLRDCPNDLDRIERTLTDGYAAALSIEAESRRLERRLNVVARQSEGDAAARVQELTSLAQRLDGSNGRLAALRRQLAALRRHADAVRVGSPDC